LDEAVWQGRSSAGHRLILFGNGNSVLSLRQSRVLSRLRERFAINGPPMIMVAL
jgi:hypothetical protein